MSLLLIENSDLEANRAAECVYLLLNCTWMIKATNVRNIGQCKYGDRQLKTFDFVLICCLLATYCCSNQSFLYSPNLRNLTLLHFYSCQKYKRTVWVNYSICEWKMSEVYLAHKESYLWLSQQIINCALRNAYMLYCPDSQYQSKWLTCWSWNTSHWRSKKSAEFCKMAHFHASWCLLSLLTNIQLMNRTTSLRSWLERTGS